ncbi:MAG: chromosome segregation protein SMC [Pseudomonadota bacterium]
MVEFVSLRLTGFKSFVEPTEMEIRPGLTGVVGPNGCGKSNLLEGLRWVMGANSAKALRGAGMEDVIFSGAGSRPARNWAEVGLVLNNPDRDAPAPLSDEAELEVTRRITRHEEGASSLYRVNGREVRARDVQVLFADASSGANSAALVRQGQVSDLIHAKPQNRRRILEEAAGIAGLHARRRESELRLKAAEVNLARLDDVIGELEAQKTALARAARQAAKYKALSADIRSAEALLSFLRWRDAGLEVEAAQTALDDAIAAASEAAAAASAAIGARDAARAGVEPAADAAREAAGVRDAAERERREVAAEIARSEAEAERLAADHARTTDDLARERRLAGDALETLSSLKNEAASLDEKERSEADRVAEARTASEAAARRLAEREAELEQKSALVAALDERRAAATAARASTARAAGAAMKRLADAKMVLTAAHDAAPPTDVLENAAREKARAESALASTEERLAETRDALAASDAATNAAEGELRDLEKRRIKLDAEIDALSELIRDGADADFPALIEDITVAPGYENALAAALGDELMASTESEAPNSWSDHGRNPAPAHLPAQAEPLSAHVRAPLQLRRRLAAIGVAPAELGGALQSLLAPGQRLVSKEGDLWRWDGYVSRADARTAAAVRLEQRNRLAALQEDADAATVLCDRARRVYQERSALRRDAAAAAEGGARAVAAARREVDATRLKHADATREAERAAARIQSAEDAHTQIAVDCAASVAEAKQAAANAELIPENAALKADAEAARSGVARLRGEAAELRAVSAALGREAETRRTRMEEVASQIASWSRRAEDAAERVEGLETRTADITLALETARAAPAAMEERAAAAETRLAEVDGLRGAAEAALSQARENAQTAESAVAAAEDARMEARERRARREAEHEAALARLQTTEEEARALSDGDPQSLVAAAGLEPDADLPERETLEEDLEKAKRDRDRLGAVNLRAEEESAEIAQRLDDILSEREDCDEAVRKLRGAISTLNRDGRAKLIEAFEKVDANFRQLFEKLFGGGRAELRLVDAEDPLEAGLEIFASPPGKKLSSMALMSGGEQALTASALIFAVFLVNPAPVCVLDEVDAPLDDANVERFCMLLHEMAATASTRFIIITHHALTMSRMDRLYGVTMVERGVSRLVSVDLTRAEQLVAAE